ncbi:MAG TPA: hypothetical protein VK821_07295 [Dehalococcoidia bacterium]|nr:hypothetical protein [Dehalococcoidia bacterium]
MDSRTASPTAATNGRRRIELARRTCVIDADCIAIRPSPAALLPPFLGIVLGGLCFFLIVADVISWHGALPFGLLAVLLAGALIMIPLSAMGLIYGAIGSSVLIDRRKQSVTWQQGLLGLGVGTRELVPFWKIEAIVVGEEGAQEGRPTEEIAQWEILLHKKSGDSLTLGRVSAARTLAAPSLARAVEVAQAVSDLTGAPLQVRASA